MLALARLGEGGPRVSFGAVSAVGGRWRSWKGGEIDRLLQSNLTLYPGFGGGPLVDCDRPNSRHQLGRPEPSVRHHDSGGDGEPDRGAAARARLRRAGLARRRDAAGALQPGGPAAARSRGDSGLVILSVEPDGPAASAGLLVGDVIVKLGGRPIEDVDDLVDALGATDVVGRSFNLDLVRGGELVKADVLIGERPRRSA